MHSYSNPVPSRPWREIARELALETNRTRVSELSEELDRALGEQGLETTQSPTQGKKTG